MSATATTTTATTTTETTAPATATANLILIYNYCMLFDQYPICWVIRTYQLMYENNININTLTDFDIVNEYNIDAYKILNYDAGNKIVCFDDNALHEQIRDMIIKVTEIRYLINDFTSLKELNTVEQTIFAEYIHINVIKTEYMNFLLHANLLCFQKMRKHDIDIKKAYNDPIEKLKRFSSGINWDVFKNINHLNYVPENNEIRNCFNLFEDSYNICINQPSLD